MFHAAHDGRANALDASAWRAGRALGRARQRAVPLPFPPPALNASFAFFAALGRRAPRLDRGPPYLRDRLQRCSPPASLRCSAAHPSVPSAEAGRACNREGEHDTARADPGRATHGGRRGARSTTRTAHAFTRSRRAALPGSTPPFTSSSARQQQAGLDELRPTASAGGAGGCLGLPGLPGRRRGRAQKSRHRRAAASLLRGVGWGRAPPDLFTLTRD